MSERTQPAADRGATLLTLGVALIPGALTAYFSFRSGGFFAGASALVAAEIAVLLAAYLLLARRPFAGLGIPLGLTALALAGFAAWTLASSDWSGAPARATPEYARALLYLLVLVLFGLLPFSVRRIRWMAYGVAAAAVAVCAAALVARTLPEVHLVASELGEQRLGYPLGYWNALGALAGLGIVLCGHFACATHGPRLARVAGAAAVPLLATTLYYTFSRGATWAAVAAVAIYVVVGRPRGLLQGAAATLPATVVALMAANPIGPLLDPAPLAPAAIAEGERVALTVAAAIVAAAAIRALALPLDTRVERLRLPVRMRRPLLTGVAVATLAIALAATATLRIPEVVADKYREFGAGEARPGGAGSSRLLSASSNGRSEHWDVALDSFRRDRLHGEGAGTYEVAWARDRERPAAARDGHSLYLETLGELGVPGLIGVGTCLLLILGAFAARARGPDRALFAALLAAVVAWALGAAVDWSWEMPAVTVWLFALGGSALARGDSAARPRGDAAAGGGRRAAGLVLRAAGVAGCLALAVLPAKLAVSEARMERGFERLAAGDCAGARAAARSALDSVSARAVPFHLIAICDLRQHRFASAERSLRAGLAHDPDSWRLWQALAVARAAAGRDARAQARRAVQLNPFGELARATQEAVETSGGRRGAWRLATTSPRWGDR